MDLDDDPFAGLETVDVGDPPRDPARAAAVKEIDRVLAARMSFGMPLTEPIIPNEVITGGYARPKVRAEPYEYRPPAFIPRRKFLYGTHFIRRFLSTTVAPGGVGKSSLALVEAIAMVTSRPLLGVHPAKHLRVWYWCGEDPLEEIERRIAAILIHYEIDPEELGDRLFIGSGRDMEIVIAAMSGRDGAKVSVPVVEDVTRTIGDHEIDVVIVDPFVSSHRVPENDNGAIDLVAKTWSRIAEEGRCAIELVHHVRKGLSGQSEHTVEDGRGAVSLLAAARSARVLNRMTEDEASQAAVKNRLSHFRVTNGKANLAPMAEHSDWYRLESVSLGNGDAGLVDLSDRVGVVVAWAWPELLADVTVAHLREAQKAVAAGRWRENHQAKDWVGIPIARVLGLDPKADRKRVLAILKVWMGNEMFVVVEGLDEKREKRMYVEVGKPASD